LRKAHFATILAATLLVVCYAVASLWEVELFFGGVDLGRHLKNGELLLSSSAPAGSAWQILHTNFYSYAVHGDPFINHHWLSGIVFYLIWKYVGFAGLNTFYILLGAVTFLLNWRIGQRAAGWAIATAVALPMMPILAVRPNVRPEIFTLLFCAIFLTLLWKRYNQEIGWKALLVLPALEVLWVNFHIGFVFGPVFIGAFLLGDLVSRPDPHKTEAEEETGEAPAHTWRSEFYREKLYLLKRWMFVLLLTAAATLLNPNGLKGAIYPFTIWGNYGIEITENHSILYLEANGYSGEYLVIKFTLIVLYLSLLMAIVRARRFPLPMLLLSVLLSCMAFFAIRNQTVMAMLALPAILVNLGASRLPELCDRRRTLAGTVLGIVILAGVGLNGWRAYGRRKSLRLGLAKRESAAADFIRTSHLPGPMLNNLNIGGYLTFYLYPQYRVYVDSRPEAYPPAFLQHEYIEPLNDEAKWRELLWERQFNLICFSYASTWEREFMGRRIFDPDWAVVFHEPPVVVLARRSLENQSLIRQHEIPKDLLIKKPPPGKSQK
jgi:hypothetical protein